MGFGVQGVGFSEPSEIIANIVIIEGDNAGLFVYNGTPSLGNPPILSITDSTTDPYGNTVTPSLSLSGLPELIYSGSPMLGNLIATISGQSGTDEFGNTYVAGAQFGAPGTEQIQLIPNANTPLTLTGTISGILGGIAALQTTDTDQEFAGIVASAILGSGATAKMATVVSSPFGTQGTCILLTAQNDGGTDTAWSMICATSTPDDTTLVITPLLWIAPYAIVLYSGASGITVVTKTSGSGNIPIPSNALATAKGECGAPGGGGGTAANFGAAAAGAGEYAAEPNLAITPGGNVAYNVGAPGTGGINGGAASTDGGNVTLTGSAVTVTANGGKKGTSTATPGNGGSGSTNTVHFNGGNGGTTVGGKNGGGGGGGAAGPASIGGNGSEGETNGGLGGIASIGGGDGGSGGNNGKNGVAGAFPGGGGGGSGSGGNGGNGAVGYAKLTYSTGAPAIAASIAVRAITDPFGTAIPAGTILPGPGDGNQYNSGPLVLYSTLATQSITSTSFTTVNGMSCPVVAGTYHFRGVVIWTQGSTAVAQKFVINGPANSQSRVFYVFYEENSGASNGISHTGVTGTITSPAFGVGDIIQMWFEGIVTFSAAGTFAIQAAEGTSGDSFTVDQSSEVTLTPAFAVAG